MPAASPRVLVVDDEPSFRSLVSQLLTDKGYQVIQAASGREALEQVGDGGCSVAVVDLVMPGMGGLELADRIKSASPDTQVVVLTGHGDMGSAIEGIHHGIFDYLEKASIDIARLERSIQEAAHRSGLLRDNRQLMQKLQETNRALKAVHDLTAGLTGEQHLDRVLEKLVSSARELCGAATARAVLFQRAQADTFVIRLAAGDGAESIGGARLHPREGLATLAFDNGAPVLLANASVHPRYSHRCDEMATDLPGFLCAPLRYQAVMGAVSVAGRAGGFRPEDGELLALLARHAAVGIENALQHEQSLNFFIHASDMLVSLLDQIDVFYPGHSRGVAALSDMVSRRLGLSDEERRDIHYGALLHDIGKLRVERSILSSDAVVSAGEMEALRKHPVLGAEMLRPITLFEGILPIIHGHHERWDGQGYPLGLAGEEIPLGARVVGVAEAFDAMTRETPHGRKRTPDEGLAELEACAGTQFDPRLVRLFVAEYRLHRDELAGI